MHIKIKREYNKNKRNMKGKDPQKGQIAKVFYEL